MSFRRSVSKRGLLKSDDKRDIRRRCRKRNGPKMCPRCAQDVTKMWGCCYPDIRYLICTSTTWAGAGAAMADSVALQSDPARLLQTSCSKHSAEHHEAKHDPETGSESLHYCRRLVACATVLGHERRRNLHHGHAQSLAKLGGCVEDGACQRLSVIGKAVRDDDETYREEHIDAHGGEQLGHECIGPIWRSDPDHGHEEGSNGTQYG